MAYPITKIFRLQYVDKFDIKMVLNKIHITFNISKRFLWQKCWTVSPFTIPRQFPKRLYRFIFSVSYNIFEFWSPANTILYFSKCLCFVYKQSRRIVSASPHRTFICNADRYTHMNIMDTWKNINIAWWHWKLNVCTFIIWPAERNWEIAYVNWLEDIHFYWDETQINVFCIHNICIRFYCSIFFLLQYLNMRWSFKRYY